MTDEEIRDELLTALVAGHETTASSLAFAFAQLARAPGDRRASSPPATTTPTSRRRSTRSCAAGRCCPTRSRGWSSKPFDDRRLDVPAGRRADRLRLPRPPRPGDLPGPVRVPARALPGHASRAPTPGCRSAAAGAAASARASRCWRCASSCAQAAAALRASSRPTPPSARAGAMITDHARPAARPWSCVHDRGTRRRVRRAASRATEAAARGLAR